MSRPGTSGPVVRITWIGMVVNVLLAVVKLLFGLVGRSQAAVADALHSFSDLGTDLAVLWGIRFWSAPADASHPYGHRRIETLITALIGAVLALGAIGLFADAIGKLRFPPDRPPALVALGGSLLTLVLKEWLFRRTRAIGVQAASPAVVANAWHHRSDALSSVPVVVAIVLIAFRPDWLFLDQIGALIVSGMILGSAWGIARPALVELMDTGATESDFRQIVDLAQQVEGIRSVHKVRTRRVGSALHVDLHALVDGQIPVCAGHDLATRVQRKLITEGPSVADVVVHIEPDPA